MKKNILIVEDEVLIAKQLHLSLTEHGYSCVGLAISFERALEYLQTETVDLVLLDINLFGKKTGVDVANVINEIYKIPFIYLTSHDDQNTITAIKDTRPVGYLQKPVSDVMLITMVDIALKDNEVANAFVQLTLQGVAYKINCNDILYAKTEHVYVELYLTSEKLVLRISLKQLIHLLPANSLVRINRSVAVNPKKVTKIDRKMMYLNGNSFSISPKYRDLVLK